LPIPRYRKKRVNPPPNNRQLKKYRSKIGPWIDGEPRGYSWPVESNPIAEEFLKGKFQVFGNLHTKAPQLVEAFLGSQAQGKQLSNNIEAAEMFLRLYFGGS